LSLLGVEQFFSFECGQRMKFYFHAVLDQDLFNQHR